MLKKAIGITKDMMYQTVVEKDAEVLVKHLGNKEAIVSYVEQNKIPERKSSYEMLYEVMLEKLDDERAEILYRKKFHFVERRKLSVLWESFADFDKEVKIQRKMDVIERRLEKIQRLKASLPEKEKALQEEHQRLVEQLGIRTEVPPVQLDEPSVEKQESEAVHEVAPQILKEESKEEQKEEIIVEPKEEIKEEIKEEVAVVEENDSPQLTQEQAVEALLKEQALFGDTPVYDPNVREEAPTDVEDPIYKNF